MDSPAYALYYNAVIVSLCRDLAVSFLHQIKMVESSVELWQESAFKDIILTSVNAI